MELHSHGGVTQGKSVTEAANMPGRGVLLRTRYQKLAKGAVVTSEALAFCPWHRVVDGTLVEAAPTD